MATTAVNIYVYQNSLPKNCWALGTNGSTSPSVDPIALDPGDTLTFNQPTGMGATGSEVIGVKIMKCEWGGSEQPWENYLGPKLKTQPTSLSKVDCPIGKVNFGESFTVLSNAGPAIITFQLWCISAWPLGDLCNGVPCQSSWRVDGQLVINEVETITWGNSNDTTEPPECSDVVTKLTMTGNGGATGSNLKGASKQTVKFVWSPPASGPSSDWVLRGLTLRSIKQTWTSPPPDPLPPAKVSDYLTPPDDFTPPANCGPQKVVAGYAASSNAVELVIKELVAKSKDPMVLKVEFDYVLWFSKGSGQDEKWWYYDPELDIEVPCN